MSKRTDLARRLSIDPDEVPPPPRPVTPIRQQPAAEPEQGSGAAPESATTSTSEPVQRPATAPKPAARASAAKPAAAAPAAAEAPSTDRAYLRSFYVYDDTYERFRAAIHWSSRNPAGAGKVPENMSAAVEEFLLKTARDLERRYNDGEPFPVPPKKTRARRKQA